MHPSSVLNSRTRRCSLERRPIFSKGAASPVASCYRALLETMQKTSTELVGGCLSEKRARPFKKACGDDTNGFKSCQKSLPQREHVLDKASAHLKDEISICKMLLKTQLTFTRVGIPGAPQTSTGLVSINSTTDH